MSVDPFIRLYVCHARLDDVCMYACVRIYSGILKAHPFPPTTHDLLHTKTAPQKSFLFDVVSKLYVATDSNPVDMQSYELCSDMIDVVIDVSCIYGLVGEGVGGGVGCDREPWLYIVFLSRTPVGLGAFPPPPPTTNQHLDTSIPHTASSMTPRRARPWRAPPMTLTPPR